MPKRPDPQYQKVLEAHRQKLSKLAEGRNVNRLKDLYDKAQDHLVNKLQRTTPGRREAFGAHQHRALLGQVRQGQAIIAQRMAGEMGDLSRETQVESLRGLGSQITKLEKHFTGADVVLPIDEAARFYGVIDKRRTSLIRAHQSSMANYGAHVAAKIEESMALGLTTGESTEQVIDNVREVADVNWWKGEQIVRTESSWAANATHADGILEVAKEIADLYMRWTEHVSDDGVALDDRVGADSIALHGQVAKPGRLFTMPMDAEVSPNMWGKSWAHPPNRPNDRSVVGAWRPGWGGLAWEYKYGKKIYLST